MLSVAYCYQIYGCQVWTRYKQIMSKLRVYSTTIMRMMLGVPPWHSARHMFVNAKLAYKNVVKLHCCQI